MPPPQKTKDMSPTTLLKWLKVYVVAVDEMIQNETLYEEQGKRTAKGLLYAIRALEDSKREWVKRKQADGAAKFKEAKKRLEE